MAIIPKNHRFDGNVYLKTKKKKYLIENITPSKKWFNDFIRGFVLGVNARFLLIFLFLLLLFFVFNYSNHLSFIQFIQRYDHSAYRGYNLSFTSFTFDFLFVLCLIFNKEHYNTPFSHNSFFNQEFY